MAANLLWIKADNYHHEFLQRDADWTRDADLLGLLKMITQLDPRFVEAYSAGALIYAHGLRQPYRAIRYLNEGIRHNPKAWDLHRIAALIYARQLRNPKNALRHARAAVQWCDSTFDKPVVRRLLRTIEGLQDDARDIRLPQTKLYGRSGSR